MTMTANYRIELYKDEHNTTWRQFIKKAVNATQFHSIDFLSYHRNDKFNLSHLLFYKRGKLLGVMPSALKIDEKGNKILLSPYGGSYGGIAHGGDLSFSDATGMFNSLETFAQSNHIDSIRITLPPNIYYDQPCAHFEFLLLNRQAQLINHELSQAIDTSRSPDEIFESLTPKCRNKVRKAEKMGMNIQLSDDVKTFYKILMINKQKHNGLPTHTFDEITAIRKLNPDWAKIFLASTRNNTIAGGVMVMCCNKNVLLSFYTCHLEDFNEYSPVNLLNYKIACWAHSENFKWFDLGTSTANMEIRQSLIDFKESFGSLSVTRDTYQLDISKKL